MATVRVAHAEPLPGKLPTGEILTAGHLVVLADDAGHRAVPIWVRGGTESGVDDLARLVEQRDRPPGEAVSAGVPKKLTTRLLGVAGASVTGVDLDVTLPDAGTLGPEVTVARVELTGRSGTRHVAAGLGLGLAIAVTAGAPIRVPDAVMDRLGAPVAGDDLLTPFLDRVPPADRERFIPGTQPRYEPRNMDFAEGLTGWLLDGSFRQHSEDHWKDYAAAADNGTAVLHAATPDPAGFAILAQVMWADDYRGSVVRFRSRLRKGGDAGPAGLFVRVETPGSGPGPSNPVNLDDVLADAGTTSSAAAATPDWAQHEVTAHIPGDCRIVLFGIFLAGSGRIELREPELARGT